MRRALFAVFLFTSSALAADEPAGDLKALQGTWNIRAATLAARDHIDDFAGMKLVVKGTDYTITLPGNDDKGTIKLDEAKSPKHIDLTTQKGGPFNRAVSLLKLRAVEQLECLVGSNLEPVSSGAGAHRVHPAQQVQRRVPQCRQHLRGVPRAHPAPVLVERHVPHVVQLVLDPPVRTDPPQQHTRGRARRVQTAQVVLDLARLDALDPTHPLDAHHLSRAREPPRPQQPAQQLTALRTAGLDAPVPLVPRAGRAHVRVRRRHRGKKPPWGPATPRSSA